MPCSRALGQNEVPDLDSDSSLMPAALGQSEQHAELLSCHQLLTASQHPICKIGAAVEVLHKLHLRLLRQRNMVMLPGVEAWVSGEPIHFTKRETEAREGPHGHGDPVIRGQWNKEPRHIPSLAVKVQRVLPAKS